MKPDWVPEIKCPECDVTMPADHLKILGQHVINKHDYVVSQSINWMDTALVEIMQDKKKKEAWNKYIDQLQKEGKSGYSCAEGCDHWKDV